MKRFIFSTVVIAFLAAGIVWAEEKKGCGCCTRSTEVMNKIYFCSVNLKYPNCRSCKKGFDYDMGEA